MTIEIHRRETEALIQQRLKSGAFHDVEEVLLHALKSSEAPPTAALVGQTTEPESLVQFFRRSPLVGLELELNRDRDTGRDIVIAAYSPAF